jgi:predicted DNA-binding antitoxin AbrB/MazE fold protein
MVQGFQAIYEHGILRPLTPLELPESAEVTGFVQQRVRPVDAVAADPLIGLMSDEPELVDAIVEEAMIARESHAFRAID